jgi:hypothetical protein
MKFVNMDKLTVKTSGPKKPVRLRVVPEQPTEQLVKKYLEEFRSDERYFLADEAISQLVKQFPRNSHLEHASQSNRDQRPLQNQHLSNISNGSSHP